jgi:hypothetical protein
MLQGNLLSWDLATLSCYSMRQEIQGGSPQGERPSLEKSTLQDDRDPEAIPSVI